MKPIEEVYTVRRRNPPRHQHHPPSRFCSPTKCAVVCLVLLFVVGAIIGLVLGLVLPIDPQEQAPEACTKGFDRVPFIRDTHCVDVDECNGYPVLCPREFRCTNLPGSYRCEPCGVGHVASPDGRTCFPVHTPPLTDACQRNKVCAEKPYSVCYMRDNTGIFYCICAHGYIEVRGVCQVRTQCSFQSCLNGGVCVTTNEQHVCLCQPGYSGEICQTVSHCLSNPCQHGVCVDAFNGFYCNCNKDWTGDLCDLVPDDCSNNDCDLRHSVCVDDGISYYCLCDVGWQGSLCSEQIPTTTATPEITTTTTADPCAAGITWTPLVAECISGHNDRVVLIATSHDLEYCRRLCENEDTFVCCAAEYNAVQGKCQLSADNKVSAGADYRTTCSNADTHITEVASCRACPGL